VAPTEPGEPVTIPSVAEMNQDPGATGMLLFDLLEKAERAEKKKDYAAAAKYYEALGRAVPERATAFSKLCQMYEALGERDKGVAACFVATGLDGVKVEDNLRFVSLILNKPTGQAFTDAEMRAVRGTFEHLEKSHIDMPELDLLKCQFAVSIEDGAALRAGVSRLREKLPGSPLTLTYAMSLALFEGDFDQARGLIEEARKLNMSAESIKLMEDEVEARQSGPGEEARAEGAASIGSSLMVPFGTASVAAAAALLLWAKRRRPKTA